MSKPSIEYTILEIEENDIERGGLLEVLRIQLQLAVSVNLLRKQY